MIPKGGAGVVQSKSVHTYMFQVLKQNVSRIKNTGIMIEIPYPGRMPRLDFT